MEHPARSDFDILVTETGVTVTFKLQTASTDFIGSPTPTPTTLRASALSRSLASNTQDAIQGTWDYSSDEVQDMA
jgi:hypothetical protein